MQDELIIQPSNGWLATFADLMSLLMCFFVLLLSFSEMDVLKMKEIAGSMRFAFGVQNKIPVTDIPKGTSIIAQEFSPGKPQDTPINTVRQFTMNTSENSIEFQSGEKRTVGGKTDKIKKSPDKSIKENKALKLLAEKIKQKLSDQIANKQVELENLGDVLVIRINERGSFAAGSAFLQPKIKPYIASIIPELNKTAGEIRISGHTDSLSINNELFSNNWELAAARAISVVKIFATNTHFDTSRLVVESLAANKPLLDNNSAIARSKNRRVEITIYQGKPKFSPNYSLNKGKKDNG
jgi:chemotaxis protein MotB